MASEPACRVCRDQGWVYEDRPGGGWHVIGCPEECEAVEVYDAGELRGAI